MTMRTKIFELFTDLPSEFREDFGLLWSLEPDVRAALSPYVLEYHEAETNQEAARRQEEAIANSPGEASTLLRVFKVLAFICRVWNEFTDTVDGFVSDIRELGLLPEDDQQEEVAEAFLKDFLSKLQEQSHARLRRLYANSLLPSYVSASTLVDMRMVYDQKFGTKTKKIEEYSPSCVDSVPVVVVKLRRDSGSPREFIFQCEESGLRRLVDILSAGLRDCREASASMEVK